MRNKIFILLSALLFLSINICHGQLKRSFKVEGFYANPWYIHALNDDSLIVVDVKNNNQALQIRSTESGKIINSQSIGRGPGELSTNGAKIINTTEEGISLWDSGLKQINKYSRALEYKTTLLIDEPVFYVALAQDSLAYATTRFITDEFLRLYELDGKRISTEPIHTFTVKPYPKLQPLADNYLLQQGPFLAEKNTLYIGFEYSSLIVKVTPDSITYINGAPANIPLPTYQAATQDGNSRVISAPEISEYPAASLDFSTDSNYLYVLHSGKKLDAGRLRQIWMAATGSLGEKIEDLDYSTTIFLYDKETGEYLRTLNLPQKAKKIAVSESYIFGLSLDEEGLPIIVAYQKPN